MCFRGNVGVGRGGGRRGFPQEQGLLDYFLIEKHLTFVLGLDSSNNCGNRRSHCAYYGLLEGEVYDLRVSCDFVKMGNCSRELVYICEPA